MKRIDYILFYISNALVAVTGLVYGYFRYFHPLEDPFSIVSHPWQPHLQHLHILFAPILIFFLGHLFYRHAWLHWKKGEQEGRMSGLVLVLCILPMIFSGYGIQVSVGELSRQVWIWIHGIVSLFWIGVFLFHIWVHIKSKRKKMSKEKE